MPPIEEQELQADQQVNALALKRGLPMSIEAEMFVLGLVIVDGSVFPQVGGALDMDDFAIEKHRRIFRCMKALNDRGDSIEYLTLGNELDKFQQLENVGGFAYLASLSEGMPKLSHLADYIKIVKHKSILRRLHHTAQQISASCVQEGREVDEILSDAESSVMRIGTELLQSELESPQATLEKFDGGIEAFLDPSKRPKGLNTPFHRFNELTNGLRGGQLIILAARPAMGKTAMALNIASHVASPHGSEPAKTVAVFSLEMSKEALLTRILCAEAKVDQSRFRRGHLVPREQESLVKALSEMVQSGLLIDDTASINMMEITSKCRRLKAEKGLDLVIVDYLQLLGSKGKVENRVQEISAFSRGLKLLAKDLNIPVIALSQLSRATESLQRGDPRPRLSDLRDSGSIEQDADLVAFIFREEVYKQQDKSLEGLAELIIGKQRNGPTGRIKLAFYRKYAKFENLAAESQAKNIPPEGAHTDSDVPPF